MRKITLTLLLTLLSLCTYAQLALEGFESPWTGAPAAPPGGWVVYKQIGNITWAQSPTDNTQIPPYQGTNAAYLNKENVTPGSPIPTNWLITPQFNSPTNGILHFYSRMIYPGDYGSIFKIKIAVVTDPTVPAANLPWVDLVPPMGEMEMNPTQQQYVEKTMSIPAAYNGQQVRIAFIMEGDDQERWLIDDVEVTSVCNPPSTLTATNTNLTSVDLNWTTPAGINTWELEIVQASNTPVGAGEIYTGTLPYHKTGLTSDTDYKFYVRSVCSDGGESQWIGPVNFSTTKLGEKCNAPIVIPNTTLPYTNVNNTALFDNFYAGVPGTGCGTTAAYLNGNDVVYSYTPTFTGTLNISLSNTLANAGVFVYTDCNSIGINCNAGAVATATVPAVIPGMAVTAGVTYYIVVSSPATTVPYTLTLQRVYCNAPTGLAVSGQTPVSANLTWATGTATAWQIMVQPADTGFPTVAGQNVTQNTNVLVNTTTAGIPFGPATNYEYYVRASCNDGTYSIWTGPFAFSTTQVSASLPYSENFEASHGWSLNNGAQPNKWIVGTSTANLSAKSLYITNDNGLNNIYTINVNSVVQAYRDIQIPAGATLLGLTFDLKAGGELNDYVRAWIVPTSFIPLTGTPISAAADRIPIGANYNLAADWTTKTDIANVAAFAGTTRRLVFEWRNNTSTGLQPAAAIDNINVALVTCAPPTALASTVSTPTSATFTWTAPTTGSPGSYEYYYSQSPIPPTPTTTEIGSVTGTTVTISPLNETETYYMWIRSNCGAGKSFWAGPVSVLVPQTPATLPYTQNFDGAASLFTYSNGTQINKWVVGQAVNNSPSKSLYISQDNGLTNTYDINGTSVVQVYKDITIPATATDINVSFDYKSVGETNDYFRVWMVPATFSPLPGSQISAAAVGAGDRVMLGSNFQSTPNWTNIIMDTPVTPYQTQKRRLVFEWRNNGVNGNQSPAAIDNLNVSIVTCQKPTALAVINVTNTSATLDWAQTGAATNWEVAYMPAAGATTPTTPGIPVSGNSDFTPPAGTFVPGTQYVFYVRTNCGGASGISTWAGPFLFAIKPANDECAQATMVPDRKSVV